MWNHKIVNYKKYYGKNVAIVYKYATDEPSHYIFGKLKCIYEPIHDIQYTELTISVDDSLNHISVICSNLIENVYLDKSKTTRESFYKVLPLLNKKLNRDCIYSIFQFIKKDYEEI
jgi:hypothetical protein